MSALIANARREAIRALTDGRPHRPSYLRLCVRFLRQWGVA